MSAREVHPVTFFDRDPIVPDVQDMRVIYAGIPEIATGGPNGTKNFVNAVEDALDHSPPAAIGGPAPDLAPDGDDIGGGSLATPQEPAPVEPTADVTLETGTDDLPPVPPVPTPTAKQKK